MTATLCSSTGFGIDCKWLGKVILDLRHISKTGFLIPLSKESESVARSLQLLEYFSWTAYIIAGNPVLRLDVMETRVQSFHNQPGSIKSRMSPIQAFF
ncbi:unnamed protein product [Phytophthora lilii]|uniref:Unnamed protein product n=1 Tax=Phytophthora lilii TaxID=2077276 RepID=A0A9W6TMN4_9STRA|nr:unnamed protein product [Phytophthora lilii]